MRQLAQIISNQLLPTKQAALTIIELIKHEKHPKLIYTLWCKHKITPIFEIKTAMIKLSPIQDVVMYGVVLKKYLGTN